VLIEHTSENISLYKSLFKGRDDVFAVRWEKDGKSGYMPAYFFDLYRFRAHKMKGGTFQNYADKSFLPLNDDQIAKHLHGEHFIGIYPLLPDNTSWFITADFDEGDWSVAAIRFIEICIEKGIQAYLERSRSGNGGHVWIFFDGPIPGYKSRKVALSLLTRSGAISEFDKNASYDRLFPNQDYLSGKGLGNLIALPLNGKSVEQDNTCFIDPVTFTPYDDQWAFISQIKRTSTQKLEKLFTDLTDTEGARQLGRLTITLENDICLNRNAVAPTLLSFIRDELNFPNTEFFIKQRSGKSTFGIKRYFRFIEEMGDSLRTPKGFIGKLIRFCRNNAIEYHFEDKRMSFTPTVFSFNGTLRTHQQQCLSATGKKDQGVLVAPPGSGKTIVALKIVADKRQPAMIIVHRKQLVAQ
jgi:hypothetical protein